MRLALFATPILLAPSLLAAPPALAQLHPVVEPPDNAQGALGGVDVFLLNEGRAPVAVDAPPTLQTTARDGTVLTLELIRSTADTAAVAPGGFVKLRYRLAPLAPLTSPAAPQMVRAEPSAPAPNIAEAIVTTARGTSSSFLDRFRPHEPTYFVFGAGDAGAKLQFSFAYQPFAGDGIGSYFKVAYTQTLFWAIDRPSGPITSTYSPEAFVDVPIGQSTRAAIGFRHDSNGGGPLDSVDANRVFVRANQSFRLGRGWRLDVAPQAWIYVAAQGLATDLDRFWGNASITASIAQENGVKLQVVGRGNPRSGKGAGELFLSYPLARIADGGLGLYVFGEAFTGYGETQFGYDQRDSHARIGVSFTR